MNEQLPITCPTCDTHFQLTMPVPDILNGLHSSTVVLWHEKPSRCPSCNQAFVFGIGPMSQFQVLAQAVDESQLGESEQSRIVVPTVH